MDFSLIPISSVESIRRCCNLGGGLQYPPNRIELAVRCPICTAENRPLLALLAIRRTPRALSTSCGLVNVVMADASCAALYISSTAAVFRPMAMSEFNVRDILAGRAPAGTPVTAKGWVRTRRD